MDKNIEFKSEIDLEPKLHKVEEVDPKSDLGVEVIEELPEIEPQEQLEVTLQKRREKVREKLAIVFSIGLFTVLIIGMIFGYVGEKESIQNITDMILAVSGVLSGPLGFIVGYYFRRKDEKEE